MKLAIKGNEIRGNEIITLFEMLGGTNDGNLKGTTPTKYYHLNEIKQIGCTKDFPKNPREFKIYTIEQFKGEFPFVKGHLVQIDGSKEKFVITDLKWENNQILYKTSKNEEWFTIKQLKGETKRLQTCEWEDFFYDFNGDIKKWEYCIQPITNVLRKDLEKAIIDCCELDILNKDGDVVTTKEENGLFRATTCQEFRKFVSKCLYNITNKPNYTFCNLLDGCGIWSKASNSTYTTDENIKLEEIFAYYNCLCDFIPTFNQNQPYSLVDLGYKLDNTLHYLIWSFFKRVSTYNVNFIKTFFLENGWSYDSNCSPNVFKIESVNKKITMDFYVNNSLYKCKYVCNNVVMNDMYLVYKSLNNINHALLIYEDNVRNKEINEETKKLINRTNSVEVNEKLISNKKEFNIIDEDKETVIEVEVDSEPPIMESYNEVIIEPDCTNFDMTQLDDYYNNTLSNNDIDVKYDFGETENFNSKFINALSLFKDDVTVFEILQYFK